MRPRAKRTLVDLASADARRIDACILALAENPRPPGSRKMQGMEDTYRVRVGAYRVVYRIDDADRIVLVTRIGHRREVYR